MCDFMVVSANETKAGDGGGGGSEIKKSPTMISTPVDKLIELLRNKKRVELNDAAREIGVSASSLNEWVNALEKEGFVTTEYKLAKAYLVWGKASGEELERAKSDVVEKRDTIVRMGESLLQELEKKGREIEKFRQEFSNLAKALGTENKEARIRLSELEAMHQRKDNILKSVMDKEVAVETKIKEIEEEIKREIESLGGIRETLKGSLSQDVSAIKAARVEIKNSLAELRPEIEKFNRLREFDKQLKSELAEMHNLEERITLTFKNLQEARDDYEKKKGHLSEEARQEALLNIRAQESSLNRDFNDLSTKLKTLEDDEKKELELEKKLEGVRGVEEKITNDLVQVQDIVKKLSAPDVLKRMKVGDHEWEEEAKNRLERIETMSKTLATLRSEAEKLEGEVKNIPTELDEAIKKKDEQLEALLGVGTSASRHFRNLLSQKGEIEAAIRSVQEKKRNAVEELEEIVRLANTFAELVTRRPEASVKTGKSGFAELDERLETSKEKVKEFSKEHESLTDMLKTVWEKPASPVKTTAPLKGEWGVAGTNAIMNPKKKAAVLKKAEQRKKSIGKRDKNAHGKPPAPSSFISKKSETARKMKAKSKKTRKK